MTEKKNQKRQGESTEEYVSRILRTLEAKPTHGRGYRRVGERERDAHSEVLREAYSHGYLDDAELADRIKKVHEAKYESDLNDLTDDLPSYAEMKGIEKIPVKTRKYTLGLGKVFRDHWAAAPLVTVVLSILLAIVPSAIFSAVFHGYDHMPVLLLAISIVTIVAGAIGALASFVRLVFASIVYGDDM